MFTELVMPFVLLANADLQPAGFGLRFGLE
jgi:hypothetical protein